MRTVSANFGYSLAGIVTISFLAILTMVSCKDQPYQSRHNPFCDCEADYDGAKLKLEPPDSIEVAQFDKILKKMNIPGRPYKLCKTRIPGGNDAFSTVINGKRYVVYDPKKVASLNIGTDLCGTTWVFAHELAHHLCAHVYGNYEDEIDNQKAELEADHVAGSVLYMLGANLSQATGVLSSFSTNDSETHPGREKRMQAVTEGYYSAANKESYGVKNIQNSPSYTSIPVPDNTAKPALVSEKKEVISAYCTTEYRSAKIRSQPDIESVKIGEVPPGAVVTVIGTGYNFGETDGKYADWWRILYDGKCGYCFSAYLQRLE